MKSVFLVKSPLQLLNAVEAKYHFNLNTGDCILIIMGDRKSQPQLLKLSSDMREWGNVIVLNQVKLFSGNPLQQDNEYQSLESASPSKLLSKSFFHVRRLNRIKKSLGAVKYIFVGYARYIYMKHFINIMPHEKVFLLDDGHATIQLAKERRQGMALSPKTTVKKQLKLFAKRYFQGIQDKQLERLSFFTIYDVTAGEHDEVIKNNFEHIRENIESLEKTKQVYFLGSPIVEAGILSREIYLSHLARVKSFFKDEKLVYIAHRREKAVNLDEIARSLEFKIIRFDYPIEYQLAIIGPRPSILASFFSSALDSCSLIFADHLRVISFKLDLETSDRRDEIEAVYAGYYASTNKNFVVESEY